MSGYDLRDHAANAASSPGTAGSIAPGKRSLTQSLVPVQRSLRDQQRAVVDFDAGAGDDVYDERATVDARVTSLPLSNRQIRAARRKNPIWVARLKVSAQILSTAEVDSSAFALDVAAMQTTRGLKVDGIAGPRTVAAVAGEVAAARSQAPRTHEEPGGDGMAAREVADFDRGAGCDFYDSRATVEPARDDPFAMVLGTAHDEAAARHRGGRPIT